MTTFAIVAGAIGGGLGGAVIIILGFANLLADGFSMAASNFLSARSKVEKVKKSRWIDIMLREELGIKPETSNPFKAAGATFATFVTTGFIPLIPFVFGKSDRRLRCWLPEVELPL